MPKQQQTILIVDDKPANLHALEQTLEELNVKVVASSSGNDALTATLNHDFALCILDVQMPGMDGFELAAILRKDPKTRFLPIIFLTAALLEQEEMLKGYEVGAVDYVVKPFHAGILLFKVRIFLQLAEQRMDLLEHHRQLEVVTARLEEEIRANEAHQQVKVLLGQLQEKNVQLDELVGQLKKSQAELKMQTIEIVQIEKLTALGRLTAGITHELNQPLNAIRIICGDIRRDLQKKRFEVSRLEECMTDVCGEVVRMTEIIGHMRIYSRKVGVTEKKKMDARAPIDGVLGLLRQQLTIHGVDIEIDIEEGMKILGDPVQLEQVFTNLISNAWDAVKENSSEQGKTIKISARPITSGANEKPLVVFEIKDNGNGVPEHILPQIFEPFVTGKARGQGTGLGLSVTKGIVEKHGGTIEVESTSDKGTVFKVCLPAA